MKRFDNDGDNRDLYIVDILVSYHTKYYGFVGDDDLPWKKKSVWSSKIMMMMMMMMKIILLTVEVSSFVLIFRDVDDEEDHPGWW